MSIEFSHHTEELVLGIVACKLNMTALIYETLTKQTAHNQLHQKEPQEGILGEELKQLSRMTGTNE